MKEIELDDEDGGGASGLMALLVTVMELLVETMEREAIRRMESGSLTPEEIERLGAQLHAIEAEIEDIKAREGIEDDVEALRDDLDSLVSEAVEQVRAEEIPE
ncbi:gas vesicle protein K [Halobacterium wangiae]|uniref:gas vesicle protein K n=1 Tax=Halobacterium wangiae TaxID=2902623 RepID=UPI001E52D60C|nr:gas vesicle protein K [Halobacterium wangiae]